MIFPWIFNESCCIFHDLYGMNMTNCALCTQKNLKSSMRDNLKKHNSMIFPWCILKFRDFSMILVLFSNSMVFPGLENDFAILQNSMIFPWRWKPWLWPGAEEKWGGEYRNILMCREWASKKNWHSKQNLGHGWSPLVKWVTVTHVLSHLWVLRNSHTESLILVRHSPLSNFGWSDESDWLRKMQLWQEIGQVTNNKTF